MEIKRKVNKCDLIKLKRFCTAKETINKNKIIHRMEENICNQCNQQGIHLQILQIAHPAQYQKTNLIKMWTEDLSRNFSKAKTQMAKRHRRLSTSLITGEVQIKATTRLCITPVRMVIIKNSTSNKCWRGYAVKATSDTAVDNMHWYSLYGEQYGNSLKKLKIELPYDPAIPLLGIYPEKGLKGYMHPNDHCHAVYSSQDMEAT